MIYNRFHLKLLHLMHDIGGNTFIETGRSAPDEEPNEEAAKSYNCPNDCMLYWGDRKNQHSCCCGKSHWMNKNVEDVKMKNLKNIRSSRLDFMQLEEDSSTFVIHYYGTHLLIHLPCEAKLGGPAFYQWMYPIERFLCKLKSYCRNKRYPEGSIAKGYLVEECMTFCSRYLEDVETRLNRPSRNTRFHTKSRERLRRTQNCGIVVNSSITSYACARDSNLLRETWSITDFLRAY
ncbi:hypothetical protein CXB51_025610 [Gossypium anomalum]|uniref:DUF4218 domain-containing protein n=1 Tax=Gossypium anomalum TaxID=47600 RepID=A0A8J6CUZ9_9ROSI|nr:hypothetical protein CXB51_025610 [Gossypium anomalum]